MSNAENPKNDTPNDTLAEELRELGQTLENLVRGTIENERAKELRRDISNGMREIGTQMQSALKSIGENPQFQDLADRGQKAIEQAQESTAVREFQEALARGIAQLNSQLAGFAQRVKSDDAPPATGPTTRLDDE